MFVLHYFNLFSLAINECVNNANNLEIKANQKSSNKGLYFDPKI